MEMSLVRDFKEITLLLLAREDIVVLDGQASMTIRLAS